MDMVLFYIYLLINTAYVQSSNVSTGGCPTNWTEYDYSCFSQLSSELMTKTPCITHCNETDAHLPAVGNQAKLNFIWNTFGSRYDTYRSIWSGLTKHGRDKDGGCYESWKWDDGVTIYDPYVFEAWARDGNALIEPQCWETAMRIMEHNGEPVWSGSKTKREYRCLCEKLSTISRPVTSSVTSSVTPSSLSNIETTPSRIKIQPQTKSICMKDWIEYGGSCYSQRSTNVMYHHVCVNYCKKKDALLPSFTDAQELQFVWKTFGNERVKIWSGLTRTKHDARKCKESWQWNDNTTYTAELYEEWWINREPSCREPFMSLHYNKIDDSVRWAGVFSHHKFHCVCEKNMSAVAEPIKYDCEKEYTGYDESCYSPLTSEKMDLKQCEKRCVDVGALLPSFRDEEEFDFAWKKFGSDDVQFWTGLSRDNTDTCKGGWKWLDRIDYNASVFEAWARGEPGCNDNIMRVGYSGRTGWGSWKGTHAKFKPLYQCLCEKNSTVQQYLKYSSVIAASSGMVVHVTSLSGFAVLLLLSLTS